MLNSSGCEGQTIPVSCPCHGKPCRTSRESRNNPLFSVYIGLTNEVSVTHNEKSGTFDEVPYSHKLLFTLIYKDTKILKYSTGVQYKNSTGVLRTLTSGVKK
jgi:uncharacterized protein (DUF1919 family)